MKTRSIHHETHSSKRSSPGRSGPNSIVNVGSTSATKKAAMYAGACSQVGTVNRLFFILISMTKKIQWF